MARIHLLDLQTIEQIRAGEVIERPASVVKELVENAIDAGARTISVRITSGGISEIVVQDDGEGMSPEDAQLAVQRHATSKLTSSAELFALSTLGFRGEGLASIAAVTHLELLTRVLTAVEGVRVKVIGGVLTDTAPAAAPPGTTVTVRHLFFNTPPRRAFLKSPTAEGSQIEEMMIGLALSRPQIRFLFMWEQRVVFDALPQDSLVGRVRTVLGKDWAEGLIPLANADEPAEESGIGLTGLLGPPERHKNTRTAQYFFVNKRLVKSQPLSFALSRGYGELLPAGRFPLGVVFLTIPLHTVDVNVHPTKREVKFQDERTVLHVLVSGVRRALDKVNLFKTVSLVPAAVTSTALNSDIPIPDPADYPLQRRSESIRPEPPLRLVPKPPSPLPLASTTPAPGGATSQPVLWRRPDGTEFRIVGQSHELFVLVEVEGELWVVDQHAAHERVMYEQVLATLHDRQGESQALLLPFTFELPAAARAALEEAQEYLTTLGFDIRPFGGNTYHVQATPPYFRPADTPALIVELAQARAESRSDNSVEAKLEDLAARVACKVKSVKAGQTLTLEAMKALVTLLLACRSPFVCPHGRPTMVRLPVQQLAAQFDRR
ncbi:MAG TPA: DNA mismatch repair endonuclease MutL [Candidatus Binatia bacterium]|nr:DNA mismatch repair endonuclease MutL [Candidatus Binatia bacterium]